MKNSSGLSEPNIEKFLQWAKDIDANWLFDSDPKYTQLVKEPVQYYGKEELQKNNNYLVTKLREYESAIDQLKEENNELKKKQERQQIKRTGTE